MEELFVTTAGYVALVLEAVAIALVAWGGILAFLGLFPAALEKAVSGRKKQIWLRFGVWLLLGLEFSLGADIVRTAIAPTWTQIGQLGAIAVIRTFLNFFLEHDLEKYGEAGHES